MNQAIKSNPQIFPWLVALLVFGLPTYLIRGSLFGLPTTLWEIALLLIFGLSLVFHWINWRFWQKDPLRWPISLFIIASLIALAISPDTRAALGQWRAVIIEPVIFYWLIKSVFDDFNQSRLIVASLIGSGVILSLQALWQFITDETISGRVIGVYGVDQAASPNYLALFLSPLAAIALVESARFLKAGPARIGITYLLAFLSIASGIILSGSRGGMLAAVVGGVIGLGWLWVYFNPRHRRGMIVGLIILLVVAGLTLVPSITPDFKADDGSGRLTSSNNVRWEIWRTTFDTVMPTSPIFGIGFANYQPLFTELTQNRINFPEFIAPYALHPHNFWLMIWATLGILGVIAWVWILVLIIKQLPSLAAWQIALVAGLTAWFFHGLVDTTYFKNDLAPLTLLLIAGLLVRPLREDKQIPKVSSRGAL